VKVRRIGKASAADLKAALGPSFHLQTFDVHLGQEYVVLGMFWSVGSPFGVGAYVQFETDLSRLSWAPLSFFEITDNRISRHWQVMTYEEGAVAFGPPAFWRDYFVEDLYEDVPHVVAEFRAIVGILQNEFPDA